MIMAQKKARIHQLRLEKGAKKVVEDLEKYDPQNDPNATGDPYKTLFVARLAGGKLAINHAAKSSYFSICTLSDGSKEELGVSYLNIIRFVSGYLETVFVCSYYTIKVVHILTPYIAISHIQSIEGNNQDAKGTREPWMLIPMLRKIQVRSPFYSTTISLVFVVAVIIVLPGMN
ncbi:uncharacterized protein LOC141653686 isoform X2 [Silene latifolia]|uniref:uncharacterized protein LOC141653686 isoform X2 n=1 Tax=Silene latifolia TaxID=37657 RepID=UPI003D77798C